MNIAPAASLAACLSVLLGCGNRGPEGPPLRPVQTIVIRHATAGEQIALSGQIEARNQTKLAFRISGRLIERNVDVGNTVKTGQLVARIEAQDARNSLRSAEAELAAAQATLVQARNHEHRFKSLVGSGVVSRSQYDDARQQLAAAESRVTSAQAGVESARDNVGYTELRSDAAGVVTAKGAEPGEVVQAGQMVVLVAQQGGKDAVFFVPSQILRSGPPPAGGVSVALVDDPKVTATGTVREVSPQADPTTGTFSVRVGLKDPPDAMRLGSTVVGSTRMSADRVVAIPGTALTKSGDRPAVWVVDPRTRKVALRTITVERYEASSVIVQHGLKDGDILVTAGVHTLIPGQEVRLLESAT